MDILKALKRTTILSTAAVLALGAAEAGAADQTAVLGHISASIASALAITELSAMSFGNMLSPVGAATVVLDPDGNLSSVVGTTMLYGAGSTPAGIGSGSAQETAAQAPGFFSITTDAASNVYVTFADSNGNIIDSQHITNKVVMSDPDMTVDSFTFAEDNGTTGYTGAASATDGYGTYIAVGLTDRMRVGATLHFAAGGEAPGQYFGTYYVMVSY